MKPTPRPDQRNRPALRLDHAEGIRQLLARLALSKGERTEAEIKALKFLNATAEWLERPDTQEKYKAHQDVVNDYKVKYGINVGAGRGRPKKQLEQ
jgi:hypothetical protein